MIYGQFRTYKNNLRKNLNTMKSLFKNHNVHVLFSVIKINLETILLKTK